MSNPMVHFLDLLYLMQIKGRWEYICLVPIYVLPEMKLHRLVISKTEL